MHGVAIRDSSKPSIGRNYVVFALFQQLEMIAERAGKTAAIVTNEPAFHGRTQVISTHGCAKRVGRITDQTHIIETRGYRFRRTLPEESFEGAHTLPPSSATPSRLEHWQKEAACRTQPGRMKFTPGWPRVDFRDWAKVGCQEQRMRDNIAIFTVPSKERR
jgi:hypothetical protein